MRIILLDRDGVINNDLKKSVRRIEEFHLIESSARAIRTLNQANIKVVVATNQAVVGRGDITLAALTEIHTHMENQLAIHGAHVDEIIFCTDAEPSPRRKPAPGMLLEALEKYKAIPQETPFVGDALRDLHAAIAAQCAPVLVRSGKGQKTLEAGLPEELFQTPLFENLEDFVIQWAQSQFNVKKLIARKGMT